MNEITVSAKTVEDAITEASIQLGVTSDQMEYDVIEKGSAGFLGFGVKQAVIKVRLKKAKEEPKEEKKEEIEKVKKDTPKKEHNKKESSKRDNQKKDTPKKDNQRRDSQKKDNQAPKKETQNQKKEVAAEPERTEKKETIVAVTEETMKTCEQFLHDVLKTMDMDVKLTSSVDAEGILCIEMEGDNMGILIGKRGQTLDSLQYLTNRVANKTQDGYVRVKLDTENYRKRRKDTLENLAKNIAYKVKRTKKPVSLEPMNPYERRIIHSALQGDKYITTHSEGEEPYRHVVVTLAKK